MKVKSDNNLEKMKVIFIPRRSRIRPYKMAKALKYTGKVELILLCEESFYDKELFEGIFDEVHFFTRKNILFKLPKAEKIYRRLNERIGFGFNRMIRKINDIQPHCFAEPYNHIVHVLKKTNFPVIMSDGADFTGITEGIENLNRHTLRAEKYSFENVDGIVHKGPKYEIEYYTKNGYRINSPDLTFFDNCDDDLIIEKEKKETLNELHIVYAGNISNNPDDVYIYYIDFAHELASQKIHFHIYPNPYQFSKAVVYKQLDAEEKYFHFHTPTNYKNIVKEISKYDWGLWWHDPSGGKRISKDKRKVAIGNKMFTYIEAGIPIIVGKHNGHGRKIIDSASIGISIEKSDIKILNNVLRLNYNEYLINVKKAADKFRLSSQSSILYQFYSMIVK